MHDVSLTHPRTGLVALGTRRDGRPIWPVLGGDGTPDDPPAGQAGGSGNGDGQHGPDPQQQTATSAQPGDGQRPPWERAGEPFDPDRAWRLLQNKDGDVAKAREERDSLAQRLREYEERDLSETDKATRRAESAEARAADAEASLMRYRVATEQGIPASLIDRLRGSTEDELRADAEQLLGLLPQQPAPDQGADANGAQQQPSGPRPDPSQGSRPGDRQHTSVQEGRDLYRQLRSAPG